MTNIFTKGKSANLPKKDDLKKHSRSKDHIAALKNVSEKKAFECIPFRKGKYHGTASHTVCFFKVCIASNKLLHIIFKCTMVWIG